jgi:phosphate transport system substrate-binding protein
MMITNKRLLKSVAGAILLEIGLGACSDGTGIEQIKIDGSSTVYPITEAVAEEFMLKTRGEVQVTVGISGTGGGFNQFCRGKTTINNASRPIVEEERKLCAANSIKFIELPVALDALTVVVNRENGWLDSISVEDLKTIWKPAAQSKIKRWNQVNPTWPDAPLHLYGPGPDSGTFDYFTEVISGIEGASRGDYTASEDDNVLVQGVSRDKYALGYFGYAYYDENRNILKALAIDHGSRKPVMPSIRTARNGTYQPLSRPLFIYVSKQAVKRDEVEQFVKFYLDPKQAHALVTEAGYVALPNSAYRQVQQKFAEREPGTEFSRDSHVNVGIHDLVKTEQPK